MKQHTWYGADGTGFSITAADLLDLEPFALFSERRDMERMGPIRLGFYLILRSLILPEDTLQPTRTVRLRWWLWRHVRNGLAA